MSTNKKFGRAGVALAATLALTALGASGAAPAGAATCTGADTALNHSSAATLTAAEQAISCMTNNARAAAGLPVLTVKSDLTTIARNRAADFVAGGNNYACGKATAAGISWSTCWESWVHWYPTPTATTLFNAMVNDAGTKSRLLNATVTELGIGVVNGNRTEGPTGSGAAADVLELKRNAPAPAPTPAPATTVSPAAQQQFDQEYAKTIAGNQCTNYVAKMRPDLIKAVDLPLLDKWAKSNYTLPQPQLLMWTNAMGWADVARANGRTVGKTPHVNDVMVFQPGVQGAGSVGHVALVKSVSGSTVHVSEMNFTFNGVGGPGIVTERDVNISNTTGIDFIT
jgi:surface antigen/uncharacterized protein YkwD